MIDIVLKQIMLQIQLSLLAIIKIMIVIHLTPKVWIFVQSRIHKIPRYIRLLLNIYLSQNPESTIHQYTTITLLLLSGILSTLASSFLIIGVPVVGSITMGIAALLALGIILGSLDIILSLYGDDYFDLVKDINIKEDLREIKALMGPAWSKLISELEEVYNLLSPIIKNNFNLISTYIENHFKTNLTDLYIYISPAQNTKIIFRKSDIKKIEQGLESWQKPIISLIEGAAAGGAVSLGTSSLASAIFVQSTIWTSFLSLLGVNTGIAVSGAAFTLLTLTLPIALGIVISGGVIYIGLQKRNNSEENRISKFFSDVIISLLPMAYADGVFCQIEKDTIYQFLQNEAITTKDHERIFRAIDNCDYQDFDNICRDNLLLKSGHPLAKMQHTLLLLSAWEMAKVDDIIHPEEFILYERMVYILKIDKAIAKGIQNLVTPQIRTQEYDYVTPVNLSCESIPILYLMDRFN